MKHLLAFLFFGVSLHLCLAQSVAINTDGSAANASAILDVKSTAKGVLIPRMSTAQRNMIAAPATGLLLYNTDNNIFQFRSSSGVWVNLNAEAIMQDADGDTKIKMDEIVNDNYIRFFISGDQRMRFIESTGGSPVIELLNTQNNTLVGQAAGTNLTTGIENTALGAGALSSGTLAQNNTAIGVGTLLYNANSYSNLAIGHWTMRNGASGDYNLAIGNAALTQNIGTQNTVVGHGSLTLNTTGTLNTSVGIYNLSNNSTGSSNTGVGANTLASITTAFGNTALGASAGNGWEHGSFNTFIGKDADTDAAAYTNATALGYDAQVTGSNKVRIGNNAVTDIGGQVNWSAGSDARFKKEIRADVPGLLFINQLRPVTYAFDPKVLNIEVADSARYTGFIAQEVEAAAMSAGFDFSGVVAPRSVKDYYALRYAEFTVPLVKAVQELDLENKHLKTLLEHQSATLNQLALDQKSLLERLSTLEASK